MKKVGVNKGDWGAVSGGLRGASVKSAETMAESRVDLRDVDEVEILVESTVGRPVGCVENKA